MENTESLPVIAYFVFAGLILGALPLVASVLEYAVRQVLRIMLACDDPKAPELFKQPYVYLSRKVLPSGFQTISVGKYRVQLNGSIYKYRVEDTDSMYGRYSTDSVIMLKSRLSEIGILDEFNLKLEALCTSDKDPYFTTENGWFISIGVALALALVGAVVQAYIEFPVITTVVLGTALTVFGTRSLAKVVWNHDGRIKTLEKDKDGPHEDGI